MDERILFGVPVADPQAQAETVIGCYLDQLLAALNADRVHDSGARERALAAAVGGAVDALADRAGRTLTRRDLAEVAFGQLEDRFGWYGDDAAVLARYAGLDRLDADPHASADPLADDPYRRHAAHWQRCRAAGRDDFADWWERKGDHSFARAAAAVEGSAAAVGDE